MRVRLKRDTKIDLESRIPDPESRVPDPESRVPSPERDYLRQACLSCHSVARR